MTGHLMMHKVDKIRRVQVESSWWKGYCTCGWDTPAGIWEYAKWALDQHVGGAAEVILVDPKALVRLKEVNAEMLAANGTDEATAALLLREFVNETRKALDL